MGAKTAAFRVGRVRAFRRGRIWYLSYFEQGRRRQPRVGSERQQARQMAAEINAQLENGAPSTLGFEPVSVVELRRRWLDNHEFVNELERGMRHRLGPAEKLFTQEEVFDGITNPDQPLKAWTRSLPELRRMLTTYISECTADDDLLIAARHPTDPLFVRGACRIQVLERRPLEMSNSLHFTADELQRRIDLNLLTQVCPTSGKASSRNGNR